MDFLINLQIEFKVVQFWTYPFFFNWCAFSFKFKKKKTLILSLIEMMNKNVDITKFIPLEPTLLWNNQQEVWAIHKLKIVLSSIHPSIHPSIQECEGAAYHTSTISQLPRSHYCVIKAQSLQKQLGLPIPC
jgi:hypothetical protein